VTSNEEFREALENYLPSFGLSLSDSQIASCVQHYEMLIKWNRTISLTTLTDPDEAARFHYCESMFANRFLRDSDAIADLGSGAGFPGIPLALVNTERPVTLVELNNKKVIFLKETARAFKLKNVTVLYNKFQNLDLVGKVWITRAIENLEIILTDLFSNPQPSGLAIFLGEGMREKIEALDLPAWNLRFVPVPLSKTRQLLLANRA
jgi:Predicted S-adenosylmethionine-dependent methyltransferase involved in bacterial cell division